MYDLDLYTEKGTLWFPSVTMLAMMVLQQNEMGKDAHMYHFLNNWPDVDDFPQTYDNETKELLTGSPFL